MQDGVVRRGRWQNGYRRWHASSTPGRNLVLPLLKAKLLRYELAAAQFAGGRVKSGLKPAGSIDKIGWEIYIAGVLSDRRRLRALHGASHHGGEGVTMSDFSIDLSASARTGAEV